MASIFDQYLQASTGENLNPFLGPDVTEPVSVTRIFLPYFKAWNTTFPVFLGVMNGPLKFLTARKILPLLDLLAKFKRVLACSCSPSFCVARKHARNFFISARAHKKVAVLSMHTRECSQRPFVTPFSISTLPMQRNCPITFILQFA